MQPSGAPLKLACWLFAVLACGLVAHDIAAQDKPKRRSVSRQDLLKEFDLSKPTIDLSKLQVPGLKKDAIPALTNPKKVSVGDAMHVKGEERVASVVIDGKAVAYPLSILMFHEIANDQIGSTPIAATYCPLCDSVAVYDRRIKTVGKKEPHLAEFGVSGFLLNSNVVMYDRKTQGLWPQLLMKAITGPHAGQSLVTLPAKIETYSAFVKAHPKGQVLSNETGHRRPYGRNPYEKYWKSSNAFYKTYKFKLDDRLPPKTLGFGVVHEKKVWFVTLRRIQSGEVRLETDAGSVVLTSSPGGASVTKAPAKVMTLQSFYHSFSAFHPNCTIVDVKAKRKTL